MTKYEKYKDRYKGRYNEYRARWAKEQREELKRLGLCRRCGKVPARKDTTTCYACGLKNSDSSLAWYYRKKAAENGH